jgi:excisionase family DNA binding protein
MEGFSETFLSTKDVARYLKKSVATVQSYIRTDLLKAVRVGRDYLIKPSDVEKFLEAAYAADSALRMRRRKPKSAPRAGVEAVMPTIVMQSNQDAIGFHRYF